MNTKTNLYTIKTLTRLAVFTAVVLIGYSSYAQFTSSSKGSAKPEGSIVHPESARQQDINLLEQKAEVMERDFLSGNVSTFNNHKTEVLAIMDREISRSGYDLAELRSTLATVEGGPDSPEGRALRIEIMQMEGRVNKQKFIRSKVAEFTSDKINAENTRELSGLKAQYFQFIESMKANLKYSEGGVSSSGETVSSSGASNATSPGKTSNAMLSSGMVSSTQSRQELPDSYYRSKDRKSAENYDRTKKNTATSLSSTAKEIQAALDQNKTQQATRLLGEVVERMTSDIAFDRKITEQLDKGELQYSGLNAGLIKNSITKKTALLSKVKTVQLPNRKGQLFSFIDQYIQLLQ